jgi:phage terminase small subunit
VAYSPEQKAAAVALIYEHGGMTNTALEAVAALLGKRVSTGTLHNWLSKPGAAELKPSPSKVKTETETEKSVESAEAPDADLDPQHLMFVDAYFELNFHGTNAAIKAGYSPVSAAQQASRLLKNAKIQAEIQRRLELMHLGKAETQALMSDIAKGTMADFLTVTEGGWKIDLDKAEKAGKLHLVRKIRERKDGTVEVELYAKDAALRDIGKHHGLWKDGIEINVNIDLLTQLLDALELAGLDATATFERMIQKAHERAQHTARQSVHERLGNRPD